MDEEKICGTCRYNNSNIPCGTTPSACKKADKFAEEFVDELKKLKPTAKPCKDDLIRRSDAIKAVTSSADYVADAVERLERIPAVEPNLLIVPETIERGYETYIGENIVVVHHDDFMDMKCKAMMWDEYGKEPKHGEWNVLSGQINGYATLHCKACGNTFDMVTAWRYHFCPQCGADMRKGADDE